MNRTKLLLIVMLLLFLGQTQVEPSTKPLTSSLNLNKRITPVEFSRFEVFAKEFNMLAFALGVYYLDARSRLPKDEIKEELLNVPKVWEEKFGIRFDLDKIDFKKKGFTRYYPFIMNDKDFIIRIFEMQDRHYLESFEVYYEGAFEDSNIGFQIIPGINSILKDEKIEKISITDSSVFGTHS